jgi:hypothetical protein
MPTMIEEAYVQAKGYRHIPGALGTLGMTVEYIQIGRHDGAPMSWAEIQAVFNDRYPDRWAFQMFPPDGWVLDIANLYHLWILPEGFEPGRLNIARR